MVYVRCGPSGVRDRELARARRGRVRFCRRSVRDDGVTKRSDVLTRWNSAVYDSTAGTARLNLLRDQSCRHLIEVSPPIHGLGQSFGHTDIVRMKVK